MSYYEQIYNLITTTIYGDMVLTADMTLSASLISTCLSMLCVFAPLILAVGVGAWLIKRG